MNTRNACACQQQKLIAVKVPSAAAAAARR